MQIELPERREPPKLAEDPNEYARRLRANSELIEDAVDPQHVIPVMLQNGILSELERAPAGGGQRPAHAHVERAVGRADAEGGQRLQRFHGGAPEARLRRSLPHHTGDQGQGLGGCH